jgi:hypothetical protein
MATMTNQERALLNAAKIIKNVLSILNPILPTTPTFLGYFYEFDYQVSKIKEESEKLQREYLFKKLEKLINIKVIDLHFAKYTFDNLTEKQEMLLDLGKMVVGLYDILEPLCNGNEEANNEILSDCLEIQKQYLFNELKEILNIEECDDKINKEFDQHMEKHIYKRFNGKKYHLIVAYENKFGATCCFVEQYDKHEEMVSVIDTFFDTHPKNIRMIQVIDVKSGIIYSPLYEEDWVELSKFLQDKNNTYQEKKEKALKYFYNFF